MAISVTCPNGHRLKASEKQAGKTFRCPACKVPVTVPALEPKSATGLDSLEGLDALYQAAPLQPLPSPQTPLPSVGFPDSAEPLAPARTLPPSTAAAAMGEPANRDSPHGGNRNRLLLIAGIAGVGGGGALAVVLLVILKLALSGGSSPSPAPVAQAAKGSEASPSAASASDSVRATTSAAPTGAATAAAAPQATDVAATTDAKPKARPVKRPTEDLVAIRQKLRKVAIAFHTFHDVHRCFMFPHAPSADAAAPTRGPKPTNLSWRVHLLPFLGQKPLYDRFHLDEPWDSPHNQALLDPMPEIYRIGAADGTVTRIQVLTGPDFLFGNAKAPRMSDAKDGMSQTILALVVGPDRAVPWTMPDALTLDAADPLAALGGLPDGFIWCVMADGELLTLEDFIEPASFLSLATPSGNEVVDAERLRREFDERYGAVLAAGQRPAGATPAPAPSAPAVTSGSSPAASRAPLGKAGDVHANLSAISTALLLHNQFFWKYTHPTGPGGGAHLSGLSWRVHILPYLGESELYHRFRFDEPWDSQHNKTLLKEMPDVYRIDSAEVSDTRVHVLSGPGMLFGQGRPATPNDIKDGPASTALVVVLGPEHRRPWTRPDDIPFEKGKVKTLLGGLGTGNLACALADKTILSLPSTIPEDQLEALLTPSGGEVLDIDALKRQYAVNQQPDPAANAQVRAVVKLHQDRTNKLHRIGSAMLYHSDVYKSFPITQNKEFFDSQGRPNLSWRVHLLPFLDQKPLFAKFKLNEPWDSPNNRPLLDAMPDVFRDPEDAANISTTRFVVLTGPDTPFSKPHGPRMSDFKDGMMYTLLVVLAGSDRAVPWTKPEDAVFDRSAPLSCLGQPYGPAFYYVRPDAACLQLKRTLPPDLFTALVTPAGQEKIPKELANYGQR